MKDPIDLNKYRHDKILKEINKSNLKIFLELISKPIKELTPEQMAVYNEIGIICSFDYKEKHKVIIVTFRDVYYLINMLNGGVFEYIGKVDDIIESYINK